ncbi:TonB-dependent receptor plug domain-containing protein [Saccharicrinis fermentans]|uniref:Colicin I receptor n=1 Tax=Saccharicrinis fermentans DSM 9555 = JCM 21142 TaxID=869213 RepID=W7YT94_9BACT|nr:TonB-dependent receptor [Saccharicrinis fermentans]GAF05654.1 colicin I receptor precursor [Saccharicrinis fermentans DSM 9555 = JCM 21142]
MLLRKYISLILWMAVTISVYAQENKIDIHSISREQVLEMKIEELALYDLDELSQLMDIVGASSLDELYDLLLNKEVTSASKTEENLFDSPLSTTVLSHDQIIASGATCIEEALRLVPGVIVREKTNGNYDVHIRGNDNLPSKNMLLYSENMNTLVMINGRPVFNYSHGGTIWETLPIGFEDIDRIEVIRGPSSALYGPNAVSGVINIITQMITSETPLISGNFQGGSLSSYIGDIAFRKKINKKWSIGVTGNYEIRKRERDDLFIYNGEDDNGNLLYTLDGKPTGSGYYTKDEISKMYKGQYQLWAPYMVGKQTYDINTSFPNPQQSKERIGVNGYLHYAPNKYTTIQLSAGSQESEALSSTMGDVPTPYSTKKAATQYINLHTTVKNFSLQANFNTGTIDYMTGNEGFELDNKQYNIQAEYNFKIGGLDIRPGVSYQAMTYDDSPHISENGKGYLNGESTIDILAGSMRLDYKPTDKLRFVSALRAEKYNHPDDIYASWQFVASYKINDHNLLRAVYSRANQSSFIVNTYSNYTWNIVNRPYPRVMQFGGEINDYDLKTMDMFELGYRLRPVKNILLDFEAFYHVSKDFGALAPDYTDYVVYNPLQAIMGQEAIGRPDSVHIQYQNYDLKSKQLGLSINMDWVINEKLVVNANLTLQQTHLDHYQPASRDDIILHQATVAGAKVQTALEEIGSQLLSGEITPEQVPTFVKASSTSLPENNINNYQYKGTPSYFGGFSITYRPTKKIEFFPQAYFYGKQTFENQYYAEEIDGKILLNLKASYKTSNHLTLYINGKNLLSQQSREFAFMDQIPVMILAGIQFKL